MKIRSLLIQVCVLLVLSVLTGAARQFAPGGLSWIGHWPSASSSAEASYKMMARPGDAPFLSLSDAIELNRAGTATFLDARSHDEYAQGRIPGARNLPFYGVESYQDQALKGLNGSSLIVIYCEGIGCELSFFLSRELQSAGYKNLRIFYGGFPEWKMAGLAIEK